MTREHHFKTSRRTGTLSVTEHADRVSLRLTFSQYGVLGDEADIARQLAPLLARFDRDPRPLHFNDPHLGQRAVIDFDTDGRPFAVCTEEPRQ